VVQSVRLIRLALIACSLVATQAFAPPSAQIDPAPTAAILPDFADELLTRVVSATDLAFAPSPNARMLVTRQTGQVDVFDLDGT
jgi:hypothetical protein